MKLVSLPLRYGTEVSVWAFGNDGAMRSPGHTVTSFTFISCDLLQATFSAAVLPIASQSCFPNKISNQNSLFHLWISHNMWLTIVRIPEIVKDYNCKNEAMSFNFEVPFCLCRIPRHSNNFHQWFQFCHHLSR